MQKCQEDICTEQWFHVSILPTVTRARRQMVRLNQISIALDDYDSI